MIPIVTPEEMAAIDAAAPEPVDVLIERAGAAVARAAVDILGGTYGRRVTVVAGKGNNGADGRAAGRRLRRRGVRVVEVDAAAPPDELPAADLVVDAAYGTGFRGTWEPPPVPDGTPVLAVDVPTGIDGLTGEARGRPWPAVRTVTFAALKPGLVLGDGPDHTGEVEMVDIGLDVSRATAHLVTDRDVTAVVPARARATHKWRSACWIVAGSSGMTGSAQLAARGAQRAGAGYVRLSSPGLPAGGSGPTEAVGVGLPEEGWDEVLLAGLDRVAAVAVGPGLGRTAAALTAVRAVAAAVDRPPLVVDGDGLTALAPDASGARPPVGGATVLTPHDGELARLGADPSAPDRIAEVRSLAAGTGAVVLAKGPTTVVAAPDGAVRVVTAGDARLATAGTGDVLTGVVTALLALGVGVLEAAALGAHLHGRAAGRAAAGLVAGDLPELLPDLLPDTPPGPSVWTSGPARASKSAPAPSPRPSTRDRRCGAP